MSFQAGFLLRNVPMARHDILLKSKYTFFYHFHMGTTMGIIVQSTGKNFCRSVDCSYNTQDNGAMSPHM